MNRGSPAVMARPQIEAILPHRGPMLQVDEVVQVVPGDKIVALRHISSSDPVLRGHFPPPGQPIFPGVLVVEALAQSGAILVHQTEPFDPFEHPPMLLGIDRARFRRPVRPGDTLRMVVTIVSRRDDTFRLSGKAYVNEQLVADALLLAALGGKR